MSDTIERIRAEWCGVINIGAPGSQMRKIQADFRACIAEIDAAGAASSADVLREVTKERDEARAIAEEACWMMERCHACGHRLRSSASGCPQCHASAVAPWKEPAEYPDRCGCERCVNARAALAKLPKEATPASEPRA